MPVPDRVGEWRVAMLFTAVGAALYRHAVFGGEQFFYRDLAMQWHPQVEAFVRAVAAGSWPVWNPYISFGQPLLANPNAQILYPITWLQLLMPAWSYYTGYAVFHFVLAGCGTYALGRHLGLSRGGALTAGLLWVLSGPFLSLGSLWHHFAAAAWLPWAVRAGDRALERFSVRASLGWGALLALIVLAGSPETPLMALAAGAFLAIRHVPVWRREPRRTLSILAGAPLAFAFAALLAAGQWMPTLEIARFSTRADLPATTRDFWSVHPVSLTQIAFPVFADRLPLQAVWRDRLFESREPFLGSLYLGLPSLALMAAGISAARGRRWTWALLALAVLSILLAVGRYAPVYEALATAVPPLRSLRYPVKTMVLVSLCTALIGGQGFDAWRARRGTDLGWTLLALALLLLAAVALSGGLLLATRAEDWGAALVWPGRLTYAQVLAPVSRSLLIAGTLAAMTALLAVLARRRCRPPVLAGAVVAVALVDLAAAERGLNPTAPKGVLTGTPQVITVARPAPNQRTFVYDYARGRTAERLLGHASFVTSRPREDGDPWHGERALFTYAHPALLGLWGREGSYGVDALKLLSRDVTTVNALVELNEASPALMHRLLRLGAVDPVIALHRAGFEELRPVASLPSLFPEPILVFRVPDPLPRTYVVGRARIAPPGQGWRALIAPDFDPAREVVLPEGPVLDSSGPVGTARIVEMRPDRVTLEADLDEPGYVVLVDAFDPGWKATIDEQETRLLRANVAFRAVQAPAGRHRIRFVYRPAAVSMGLATSALAASSAIAFGLARWRRIRHAAADPSPAGS